MTRLPLPAKGEAALHLAAAAATTLIACWVLGYEPRWFSTPFAYGSDCSFTQAVMKGLIETGGIHNPQVGAPGGLVLYDFPGGEWANVLVLKLLGMIFRDWVRALNAFYLLGFALVAMAAIFALRRLGAARAPAAVAGILYALMPYHFFRGEQHLMLASYFYVPLACLLVVWVAKGEPVLLSSSGASPSRKRAGFALLVCALLAASGIYYAYFSCYFFCLAGMVAAIRLRSPRPLANGLLLSFAVVAVGAVLMVPNMLHWREHGPNFEAVVRVPREAEAGAFKLAQLLLPVNGHRLAAFARFKEFYNRETYLVTENQTATLGVIGAAGLLFLIFALAARRKRGDVIDACGVGSLGALLLGMVGGIGSLIAYVVPQFRGYNRISVFLEFFALAGIALALGPLIERIRSRWIGWAAWAGLLVIGVLDQTSPHFRVPFHSIRAQVDNDRDFVRQLEAALPPGAMVYQLPYMPFPEAGLTYHRMLDYDHFRPYLHSRSLRWSYGSMRGREGDLWLRNIDSLPVEQQIDAVAQAGFSGLYLDRFGFDDDTDEKAIEKTLGKPAVLSRDRRYAFHDLRARIAVLKASKSAAEWQERQKLALDDPRMLFHPPSDTPKMLPGKVLSQLTGNIDLLSGAQAHANGQLLAAGWAIDEQRSLPARGVAVFEGTRLIEYVHTSERRDDVSAAKHTQSVRDSGWRLRIRARALGLGKHQIGFYAVLDDGSLAPIPYHGDRMVEVTVE